MEALEVELDVVVDIWLIIQESYIIFRSRDIVSFYFGEALYWGIGSSLSMSSPPEMSQSMPRELGQ